MKTEDQDEDNTEAYDVNRGLPDDLNRATNEALAFADDLITEGRFDDAIAICETGLAMLPQPASKWRVSTRFRIFMGDAFYLSNRYEQAIHQFIGALRSHLGIATPFVHLRLGQCFVEEGDLLWGKLHLNWAWRYAGDEIFDAHPAKYFNLIRDLPAGAPLTLPDHDGNESLVSISSVPDALKAHVLVQWRSAMQLLACQNYGEARSILQVLLTSIPNTSETADVMQELYAKCADVDFRMGNYQAVGNWVASYKPVVRAPYSATIPLRYGQACYESGDAATAINALALAVAARGKTAFDGEDERLWAFVSTVLPEPPGGWATWECGLYLGFQELLYALDIKPGCSPVFPMFN